MIESGLYEWVTANPNIQPLLGNVDAQRVQPFKAFYFSFYPKGAPLPGIVLDRLQSQNESETLDAGSRLPGQMIEARFQFGSLANFTGDGAQAIPGGPESPSGYLAAAALSLALKRELQELANGRSALPDGTIINDVRIEDEYDAHYEVGGTGYMLRRVLAVTIIYTEAS
jgi:hypothetical protein